MMLAGKRNGSLLGRARQLQALVRQRAHGFLFNRTLAGLARVASMMRATRANKPDGYLLGSNRIATAPEPNSSRLTSFKSIRFDSPRTTSARGPPAWTAPRTRTHRSIPAPPTPAGASPLPRTALTRLPLQLLNGLPQ